VLLHLSSVDSSLKLSMGLISLWTRAHAYLFSCAYACYFFVLLLSQITSPLSTPMHLLNIWTKWVFLFLFSMDDP
jgi:hypothetical protein